MRSTSLNPISLVLAALFAAHGGAVGAQQEGSPPGGGIEIQNPVVFTANIEMVRVPVVVTDLEGGFITGLDRRNFLVQDGPAVQLVEHFVSDHEPTSVGIVLDASAAMEPFADLVRGATRQMVEQLKAEDELCIVSAGGSGKLLAPLSEAREPIHSALDSYSPEKTPGRAFYDGIALALSELDQSSYDKRALIVFTAGDDNASRVNPEDLTRAGQRLGVAIHAVRLSTAPIPSIEEIVRSSGGLIARRPGIEDRYGGMGVWLDLAVSDICRYVNNQYLLHYTPLSPPPPGMWRRIRVKVDVPFEEVRARSGYVRW